MAEKILNTRVLMRYDSLENWNKSTLALKKGEIAFCHTAASAGTGLAEPVLMMKVGTAEEKTFSELPWSFYAKASDVIAAAKSEEAMKTFINNVIAEAGIATDEALSSLAERVTVAEGEIDTLQDELDAAEEAIAALEVLVGEKSVAEQIAEAIAELDLANTYETKTDAETKLVEAKAASEAVQTNLDEYEAANDAVIAGIKNGTTINGFAGVEAALAQDDQDIAAALAEAQAKVASVTAGDASVTIGGTTTAPTVAAKLSADADNALTLAEDGLKVVVPAAAEYSIVKAENSGDYAAIYNLTKDGEVVGASINIPKDMVVESGAVVENPDGQAEGTYIELKLQNVEEPLYINVGNLIEYVTSGSTAGDMVVVNVSDDHKVTATITDGTITLAKLTTEVQTAVGKAHVHENADVLAGITADQVEGWDDADAKAHEHENADVLDGITSDKVAAWDAAEQNAKDYADELNVAMDERMDAVEASAHAHENETVLNGITAEKVAAWDAAEQNAKDHADELNTAMDERVTDLESGKVDDVTAAADSGLKATRTENTIAIEIDDSLTFVLDCGDSTAE